MKGKENVAYAYLRIRLSLTKPSFWKVHQESWADWSKPVPTREILYVSFFLCDISKIASILEAEKKDDCQAPREKEWCLMGKVSVVQDEECTLPGGQPGPQVPQTAGLQRQFKALGPGSAISDNSARSSIKIL